jgi:hypothetical protein
MDGKQAKSNAYLRDTKKEIMARLEAKTGANQG